MNEKVGSLINTLKKNNDYLIDLSHEIIEESRSETSKNLFNKIYIFSENLSLFQEASIILSQHNVLFNINFQELNNYLLEVNVALEKGDYFLLADLFEYEIIPFLKGKFNIEY